MLPYILAAVGGYLIGDSMKKQYAEGGMMAKGGKTDDEHIYFMVRPAFVNELMDKAKKENVELEFIETDEDGNEVYFGMINFDKFKEFKKLPIQYKYADDGDIMAKGGFVAVSEKDGYWTIISKPTTKEKAQEVIKMGGLPRGEVGKVVTTTQAKSHKKLIGEEYLADGGMMAKGGLTESQEELISDAIASEELKEKARKKIKALPFNLRDAVLAVGYTDYGGTFDDKVLIEYFKKKYPKNIVYERAGYNGQNAILFGLTFLILAPLATHLFFKDSDFGDYYMIKERETEEKEFKEFVKHLKYKKYKVLPNTLDWLLENRSGYYKLEPNGLDFNSEELENELIEEGLIKK